MIFGCYRFWMLRTCDALIVTPMRGSFLPRSYRSIYQPRGVFSTVLLKSVAVCFYAPWLRMERDTATIGTAWGRNLFQEEAGVQCRRLSFELSYVTLLGKNRQKMMLLCRCVTITSFCMDNVKIFSICNAIYTLNHLQQLYQAFKHLPTLLQQFNIP